MRGINQGRPVAGSALHSWLLTQSDLIHEVLVIPEQPFVIHRLSYKIFR